MTFLHSRNINMAFQSSFLKFLGESIIIDAVAVPSSQHNQKVVVTICNVDKQ